METVKYDRKRNGVFATRLLNRREQLCIYEGKDMHISQCKDLSFVMKHPFIKNLVRCGEKYPTSKLGVAQFIRDGAKLWFPVHEDKKYSAKIYRDCLKEIKKYKRSSLERSNVFIRDKTFWYSASKEIKEGDELYYSRGELYWLNEMMKETKFNNWRVILHHLIVVCGGKVTKLVITF